LSGGLGRWTPPGLWWLPVLVTVFAVLAAAANYISGYHDLDEQVAQAESRRLFERLVVEQSRTRLQNPYTPQPLMQPVIDGLARYQGLSAALLVHPDGTVLAALQRADVGRSLEAVIGTRPELAHLRTLAQAPVSGPTMPVLVVRRPDADELVGVAPYPTGTRLITVVDLAGPLAERQAQLRHEVLRESVLMLVLVLVLSALLYLLWFRRARRLTATLVAFGEGRLEHRTGLRGRDELGQLGAEADRMAERLQKQQQRLRHLHALVDRSPAVVIEWANRPGWPMTYLSRNVSQWGYAPEELLNGAIDWDDLVHPDDLAQMNAEIAAHWAAGRNEYRQEYRLRRADGGYAWIDDRTTITRDAAGEIQSISGILLDITAQKEAQLALREQKALLEQAEGLAGLGSWQYDARQRLVWWSAQMFRNIGRDPALGAPATLSDYLDCLHPDDRERIGDFMRSAAAGGGVMNAEFRRHPGLGPERWFRASLECHRASDGGRRYSGTLLDITALHRAQLALRQTNADLERRVAERTAQLSIANRELEAFSYTVSHDLKAPLRGIDGYSQLLEEEYGPRLDDDARGFIVRIRRGVGQMSALINDLLAYSRMERRPLDPQNMNLHATVMRVLDEFSADLERTGAQVSVQVPDVSLRLDADGLAVALRNLVGNALKFARPGEAPRIEVGARREGERHLLWVRDQGVGFDMKYHDRIFGIFQRLQRAEDYPGTGVGLALVAKAVQRMGGRVWAESQPGQGATFFLELPA